MAFKSYCVPIFLAFLVLAGCGSRQDREGSGLPEGQTERLVVEHLGKLFEQPKDNRWEDSKSYFLPDQPGLERIGEQSLGNERMAVYKASIWSLHRVPEEWPILVWIVEGEGDPRLGVLQSPDEVASQVTDFLSEMTFKDPEARQDLAVLIGRMTEVFEPNRRAGELTVSSKGNCLWAERTGTAGASAHPIVASCFSRDGSLEKVVPPR